MKKDEKINLCFKCSHTFESCPTKMRNELKKCACVSVCHAYSPQVSTEKGIWMNLKQVQALSNEELRIKVARLCGYVSWCDEYGSGQWEKDDKAQDPPNYPVDLNAMYEALSSLKSDATHNQHNEYCYELSRICKEDGKIWWDTINATARQRAEAFVLTMEELEIKHSPTLTTKRKGFGMSRWQRIKIAVKILYHIAYLRITGRAIEKPILPDTTEEVDNV